MADTIFMIRGMWGGPWYRDDQLLDYAEVLEREISQLYEKPKSSINKLSFIFRSKAYHVSISL